MKHIRIIIVVCVCAALLQCYTLYCGFMSVIRGIELVRTTTNLAQNQTELSKSWQYHELLIPSEEIPDFATDAVVVLAYLGRYQRGGTVKWPRTAFVIGDGSLILTAAHCVADFDEQARQAVSPDIVVISPYYGDIFEFEILAVDKEADVAILKASWPGHPALSLANEAQLEAAKEILIAGFAQQEVIEAPYEFARQINMEKLPVLEINGDKPNQAIVLKGTKFVVPGWSGSAMVLPENGKVVGILGQLNKGFGSVEFNLFGLTIYRKKNVLIHRNAQGCSIKSINALLKKHSLDSAAARRPPELDTIENAHQGFSLAMDYVQMYWNNDFNHSVTTAQELVDLRPESVQVRLFLAESAYQLYTLDSSRKELPEIAESNFEEALRLDPDNAHAHTLYGNFLMNCKKDYQEALTQTEAALGIEPDNELALVNEVFLLIKIDPVKAEKPALHLIDKDPNNPHFWYQYSSSLTALERHEEALHAAQKAVELNPDGLYRGRLAQTLEKSGRLDEAQKYFKQMTADCGCQHCWFTYARFLIDHHPNKLDEAEKAIDKADSHKGKRVSQENLTNLRYNLVHAKFEYMKKNSPEKAEAYARKLLEKSPENAQYRFELAGILRTLGRHEEAAQAAQQSVDLAPDKSYRGRLADTLAKAGHIDQAQKTYDEMLANHPERAKYWFWYARFLNNYHPERIEEARQALSKAREPGKRWGVKPDELKELSDKINSKKIDTEPNSIN